MLYNNNDYNNNDRNNDYNDDNNNIMIMHDIIQ